MRTKQVTAVKRTVAAAKKSASFTDAHAALAALAQGIAEQIDGMPYEEVPASLWKELRAAVESLVGVAAEVANESDSDGTDAVRLPAVGNGAHT